MEKLKIILLTTEYPPGLVAGSGKFILNLIEGLRKHNVTVITPYTGVGKQIEYKDGVEVRRIKTLTSPFDKLLKNKLKRHFIDRRMTFSLALRNYLKGMNLEKYDILHSVSPTESCFLDFNFINKKIPLILSVTDQYALNSSWNIFAFPYLVPDLPLRYLHHNILKYLQINAISKADKVITNCFNTINVIKQVCKPQKNKLEVVYRGIDITLFNKKISPGKYTSHNLLFVGTNFTRKGGMVLVKAFPAVLKEFPDATLTMIGCPNKIEGILLKRFIAKHGIQDKIKLIDYVQQSELPEYYNKANVFAMPSAIESFAQVYMESLMMQTPVIGTNVGGTPELVSKDVGYLIEPGNKRQLIESINQIFLNPSKSKEMGKNGRKKIVKVFTKDRMNKEIIRIYGEAHAKWKEKCRK